MSDYCICGRRCVVVLIMYCIDSRLPKIVEKGGLMRDRLKASEQNRSQLNRVAMKPKAREVEVR